MKFHRDRAAPPSIVRFAEHRVAIAANDVAENRCSTTGFLPSRMQRPCAQSSQGASRAQTGVRSDSGLGDEQIVSRQK
ncbi:hypothetical protein [Blastochloris viridis]|uniref:hypothetical protein n=1 Tax=Blastochloris viridis TaxID=1079 RepID=UPI0011A0CB8E|nr:hypothetical protein [Blastochloris viridis]